MCLEPKVKFKLTGRPVLHFGDGTLKMLLPFRLAGFFCSFFKFFVCFKARGFKHSSVTDWKTLFFVTRIGTVQHTHKIRMLLSWGKVKTILEALKKTYGFKSIETYSLWWSRFYNKLFNLMTNARKTRNRFFLFQNKRRVRIF